MKEEKRILIAGCRDFNNYKIAKRYINRCLSEIKKQYDLIIVSGGAKGADMLGERFANEKKLKIERYLPDWQKYGKAAGPKRNKEMAAVSDYIICFWDKKSRGTASPIRYGRLLDKPIRVKIINCQ